MTRNKKALIVENGHLADRALLSPYRADYLKYFKFHPEAIPEPKENKL
jgi:hypothetical protein